MWRKKLLLYIYQDIEIQDINYVDFRGNLSIYMFMLLLNVVSKTNTVTQLNKCENMKLMTSKANIHKYRI